MMMTPVRCLFAVWIFGAALAAQEGWRQTFDSERPDQPPAGFTFAAMRQSDAGRWLVQRHDTHTFLSHQAQSGATGYALAVENRPAPDDVSAAVRLRLVAGARVGGLVWRYQDDNNYYALLLDLHKSDLSIYRVASGVRIRLDVADELELDADAWHSLKVSHIESHIRVSLGGVPVFAEEDRRAYRRGATAGRVGLIATGDSETWFDDLHVEPKRGRR